MGIPILTKESGIRLDDARLLRRKGFDRKEMALLLPLLARQQRLADRSGDPLVYEGVEIYKRLSVSLAGIAATDFKPRPVRLRGEEALRRMRKALLCND